jgi:hypothetical protein
VKQPREQEPLLSRSTVNTSTYAKRPDESYQDWHARLVELSPAESEREVYGIALATAETILELFGLVIEQMTGEPWMTDEQRRQILAKIDDRIGYLPRVVLVARGLLPKPARLVEAERGKAA